MANGLALCLGLNGVDPDRYCDWPGTLQGAEPDARAMACLAVREGYSVTLRQGSQITRGAVEAAVRGALARLRTGDTFLLTFAGHGAQVSDPREPGGSSQALCLYDGLLIDDELYALFGEAPAGSRILVVADCCHSGTIVKADDRTPVGALSRGMPSGDVLATFEEHRAFYADRLARIAPDARTRLRASLRHLSACRDDEQALESQGHGLFTAALLQTWNQGAFQGNYDAFLEELRELSRGARHPGLLRLGPDDPAFDAARPFYLNVDAP